MIWSLPCGRVFLEGIVNALRAGRHVIVRAPRRLLDEALVDNIDRYFAPQVPEVLWLGDMDLDAARGSVERLAESVVPSPAVVLDSLHMALDAPGRWCDWLTSLGASAHRNAGARPAVLALADPRFPIPVPDTYVEHHVWWGRMRALDHQLLVERALAQRPPPDPVSHFWLRALGLGLAGPTASIVEALVEDVPQTLDQIAASLQRAVARAKDGHEPLPDLIDTFDAREQAPPAGGVLLEAWAEGRLDLQAGRARLLCPTQLIKRQHRLLLRDRVRWGQMRVILPLSDQVRLEVVRQLDRCLGPDWPRRLTPDLPPPRLRSVEWAKARSNLGKLKHLLAEGARRSKVDFDERALLAEIATEWTNVRNELAHGQMLEFTPFHRALENLEKLKALG